jgi:glycosyltransferase involved in cell wall biosynthesis
MILKSSADRSMRNPEISVVIPCLDEADAIERCVLAAQQAFRDAGLVGEVIVADNGSLDGSQAIADAAGARVIHEARRGYGSALRAGFAASRGEYVLMADADLTYDFAEIPNFVARLRAGADLVMGDRMSDIRPGAMPWLHRYVGNPVLTGVLNLFFRTGVRDAHCGMRAFRRDALERLDLRTTGMELASEMVIRAAQEELVIDEIPISYHPREGDSKLATFGDGWRHLRFLLVHSPTHLFILPAVAITAIGVLSSITVLLDVHLLGRSWQMHALVASSMLTVVGVQLLGLGLCAHAYGSYFLGRTAPWFERVRARIRLEHALIAGGTLFAVGFGLCAVIVGVWIGHDFGALREEMLFLAGATMVIIGTQVMFTSFLVSILGLRRRPGTPAVVAVSPAGNGVAVPRAPVEEPEHATAVAAGGRTPTGAMAEL